MLSPDGEIRSRALPPSTSITYMSKVFDAAGKTDESKNRQKG